MSKSSPKPRLLLASASPARRYLLESAGLDFEVMATNIDEARIRKRLLAAGSAANEVAAALALAKAEKAAAEITGADHAADMVILGADQLLIFEGAILEKPVNRKAARATLIRLRGKTHELVTAVAAYRRRRQIWECCNKARLTMRDFSDAFLDDYLERDDGQLSSVGAYRLEGAGAQLFSRIDGDFFTILGLPLFPLLEFLRNEGVALR